MCLIPEELCRESASRERLLNLERGKENSGETASVVKEECRTEKQKRGPLEARKNKLQCQDWASKGGKNVSVLGSRRCQLLYCWHACICKGMAFLGLSLIHDPTDSYVPLKEVVLQKRTST